MNLGSVITFSALLLLGGLARAQDSSADSTTVGRMKETKPASVEVCFVLDTTGSMSGLIAGAKRKIWSIANEIVMVKPTPKVRVGLIGYRDRGDAYITRHFDLTEDLDLVYEDLMKYQAQGGGDGPESVNQALHEAVTKPTWSKGDNVLRIIFLVGDAPPHMDYADDVKYPETCRLAARRGIIINTIQCGSMANTQTIWTDIAKRAEGGFAAIAQTGNMVVISTPMDKELAALNVAVGKTILSFGNESQQRGVWLKQQLAEEADAPVAADRLAYNFRTNCVVQGGGDLIDAIVAGKVKLDKVKTEDLPKDMRKMTAEERAAHVKKVGDERKKLQEKIQQLLKQRSEYIKIEQKKQSKDKKGDAFDAKVAEMLKKQAASKGLAYEK
ncbi:MAG: vWA domain-containing protein [Planctomycetota bacterium]|jgi:Mg-chelatase subunit ChlD